MSGIVTSEMIEKVFDLYDVKIKQMGETVQIFEYSEKIRCLKEGFTSPFKIRDNYSKREKESGEIRYDSLSRSFGRLMDLALTNHSDFRTFITLTFAENITDLTVANTHFTNWVSNVRKVYPDFKYLGVPEFQKRGAVHYHLMTNLTIKSDLIILQKNKENMYDVKYWRYGFTSVFDLALTDNDFSVSLYLAKYFYKDIDNRMFGRRKILASQNLKEPNIFKVDRSEIEKIEKYIDGKKMTKEKDIISKNDYAPRFIRITEYK